MILGTPKADFDAHMAELAEELARVVMDSGDKAPGRVLGTLRLLVRDAKVEAYQEMERWCRRQARSHCIDTVTYAKFDAFIAAAQQAVWFSGDVKRRIRVHP